MLRPLPARLFPGWLSVLTHLQIYSPQFVTGLAS